VQAPGIGGFEHHYFMSAGEKLRRNAPQEMGIAVVPVRQQGLIKEYDSHKDFLRKQIRNVTR
jgi:hypothetical protein